MKVKDVLQYLRDMNPESKVTVMTFDLSKGGVFDQREIFMLEKEKDRVVFHQGKRVSRKPRALSGDGDTDGSGS